jgi:hypothetical protein
MEVEVEVLDVNDNEARALPPEHANGTDLRSPN